MKLVARVLLSLAVAGVLVFVLARWGGVGLAEVREAVGRLTWQCYFAALGLHVVLYALRAARFQVLLGERTRAGFGGQLGVTLSYGMASIVLPAKVGELSYVLYSGRVLGVEGGTALAVLVVSRVLDLAVLGMGMGIACVLARTEAWMLPAGVGAIGVALALLLFAWHGEWLVRAAARMSGLTRLERMGAALQAVKGRRLAQALVLSLFAWVCVFLFCAVLARGLGIGDVGFGEVVFGSGLAMLTSLLPLSAFASIGTLEAGWVVGFGVFGVSRELALATGAGLHVVQLVNIVLLGLVGHVLMALREKGAGSRGQ